MLELSESIFFWLSVLPNQFDNLDKQLMTEDSDKKDQFVDKAQIFKDML